MSAVNTVKKFFPKVTRVLDATKNAAIEVTETDARSKGLKKHDSCALAVACKRKFHLDGVIISRATCYLIKGKVARRFKTSEMVAREIVSFDRGAGFAPGNYELMSVPPSSRLGVKPGRANNHAAPKGPTKKYHVTENVREWLK
jgi:hypothetical protein